MAGLGRAWHGSARLSLAGLGTARDLPSDLAGPGLVRHGKPRRGEARRGMARDSHDLAWHGSAGFGLARHVVARQGKGFNQRLATARHL